MNPTRKGLAGRYKLGTAVAIAAAAVAGALFAAPAVVGAPSGGLVSKLNGKQVVPAGTGAPEGKGRATFQLRPRRGRLCFEVRFRRTDGPVEGYIFRGKRGQEPPNPSRPAVTLFGSPEESPEAGCVTDVATKKLRRMKRKPRRFHVVLVNERFPNGAVRGQLKPRR